MNMVSIKASRLQSMEKDRNKFVILRGNLYLYIMKIKELFKTAVTNPKGFVVRIYIKITFRIVRNFDRIHDKRLCGYDLTRKREVEVEGATSYQPTVYWALDEIFKDAVFSANDNLVDVGCGMGRVIAYLVEKKFPGQLTGIEYDPYAASVARKWMEKDKSGKVRLIEGDALKAQYDQYTILYLFRPFSEEFFNRMIVRLEEHLTHPIQLYYLTDFYSRKYLNGRQGWEMVSRRPIFMKYGLCLFGSPQYFSIWKYCPQV